MCNHIIHYTIHTGRKGNRCEFGVAEDCYGRAGCVLIVCMRMCVPLCVLSCVHLCGHVCARVCACVRACVCELDVAEGWYG